jgi:hypothetical protein
VRFSAEADRPGRPLWRIVLAVILASFSLHRGAAAYMAHTGEFGEGLALGLAAQSAAGLATAAGVWLGRRWVLGCVVALGVALLALPVLAAFTHGTAAALSALSAAAVFGLGAAALFLFLRHELAPERRRSPARAGTDLASAAARRTGDEGP